MAYGEKANASPKPSGKKAKPLTQKEQSERFVETARKLGIDKDGNRFEQVIARILSGGNKHERTSD